MKGTKGKSAAQPRSAVRLSNEDKVLFPESGITKGELIEYYERIADVLLPHVRGRVVTMERHPNGIGKKSFYQKDVPDYFPEWIKIVRVEKEGGSLRQVVIQDSATLVYLANQACISLHVWPSRVDRPRHPDRVIFDLDPSTDDFDLVRATARTVRQVLQDVGLSPYVMTTGSRGLHVVAPLDRKADFERVRTFAERVARLVASGEPSLITVEQRKNKRRGRLFIDYLRNAYGQHSVAPYSVRPKPGAPIATPLDWDELGDRKMHARRYDMSNLFRRLARKKDPWRSIEQDAASLEKAMDHLRKQMRED